MCGDGRSAAHPQRANGYLLVFRDVSMVRMGFLNYDGMGEYEFDDRTLAHVKVAVTMRLSRQESFLLSWTTPPERGSGRISLWMTPYIGLAFRFAGGRPPEINSAWITVLNELSYSGRGLVILSEAEAMKYAKDKAKKKES